MRTTTTTALLEGLYDVEDGVVWQVFDDRYRPIIVGVCRRLGLSDSEADDTAQETLIQFLRDYREGRYSRDRGRLRSWIVGIARHRVIDYQRARGRRKEKLGHSSAMEVPDETAVEQLWDQEFERSILRQSVEELRRSTRTSEKSIRAFEMLIFDRMAPERVAEDLDMKPHDVYVAKSRVTTKLREIVERLKNLYEVDS
ncbi:MAG: sigma-70 family RNA polymerase sigma factor [Phycisphaerales bacterium]|nr:sigma-70 family RNA polymerase sigma factor [Phycisphaerales bacterium]|tara:strand:- start:1590 stop:2186 length:597 start_codon:yes stop_codon:yes gene_type:complete